MAAKLPPKCPPEAAHPLLERVKAALGPLLLAHGVAPDGRLCVVVPAEKVREAAAALRSLGYEQVLSLTASDYLQEGKFLLVYTFASYLTPELRGHLLDVRAEVPRDSPKVPSIADLFPSADFEERECHEMFGIWFEGNPHMGKRFLLDPECCMDERTGKPLYPLRKDFKVPDWGLMG